MCLLLLISGKYLYFIELLYNRDCSICINQACIFSLASLIIILKRMMLTVVLRQGYFCFFPEFSKILILMLCTFTGSSVWKYKILSSRNTL